MAPLLGDLVIVLPGILGSVLQKNGKDLWAFSPSALLGVFRGSALSRDLALDGDDPTLDTLDDGVVATDLMPDIHLMPGLWKIDGYSTLLRHLEQTFELRRGHPAQLDSDANLFPFPYDWRRDNRGAARRLKSFIDAQLPVWRQRSGNPNAKVILIGHSMGGLISRYYLEVLGGWEYCRALFTFGTPHRGSLCALDFLSNGHKVVTIDVTDALRSFPSVHQLLPNYRVILHGDSYARVSELEITGISQEKARDAQHFHEEIAAAVKARRNNLHTRDAYLTFSSVGIGQPTYQSATWQDGRIVVSTNQPDALRARAIPDRGDGTVPYFSAIPAELVEDYRGGFAAEVHGSLQSQPDLLTQLTEQLSMLRAQDWGGVLGPTGLPSSLKPAISVALDDAYLAGEPVVVQAETIHTSGSGGLQATLTPSDTPESARTLSFDPDGEGWKLVLEDLPAGVYRLTVSSILGGESAPQPVHDFFAVV